MAVAGLARVALALGPAMIANQGCINRLGYGNIVTYREVQMTISIKVLIGDPKFTTFVYGKCNGCDKKTFPVSCMYDNTFLLKVGACH